MKKFSTAGARGFSTAGATKFLTAGAFAFALLFACAAGAASAEEITVRGRLGRTVESGGWLILAREKYLLLNYERWQRESWFRAGTEVVAVGETKPDAITIHMEGTAFEARTLRPASQGGEPAGAQAGAQEVTQGRSVGTTRVVVTGDAVLQERPDTAVVTVAVVTQARAALDAQRENATRTEAVVRALRQAAGAGAEVETSGYNLQPQYTYREGQPPLIQSYTAQNSVTVTTGALERVGAIIDAATAAGANNVSGLSFTLRRDRPARDRALAEATRAALAKAQVVAQALGGRVARIVEVQESSVAVRPIPVYETAMRARAGVADAATQTPVETGTLDIRSQVTLVAEISTGQ